MKGTNLVGDGLEINVTKQLKEGSKVGLVPLAFDCVGLEVLRELSQLSGLIGTRLPSPGSRA